MEDLNDIYTLDSQAENLMVKKGEVLQQEGRVTSKGYFVKKGLLRAYTIDEKGKEHIFMFACEGWVVGDFESYEFKRPTKLFVDCMEDAEVIRFNQESFDVGNMTSDQLRRNAHILGRRIAVLQQRVILLMSATARERYEHFLETYPALLNRVPQKMIAAYLGMTPEALSKIKGEMARAK